MNFNEDGLLDYKDLGSVLADYKKDQVKSSHLRFGRHTEVALVSYLMGKSVEDIASEMGVTRRRVQSMLRDVQRKLGVQKPPPTIAQWVEESDMVDLKLKIKSLIVEYVATGQYQYESVDSVVDSVMEAFRTHVKNTGLYQDDE